MKQFEYSLDKIRKNISNNKKRMCVIFIICMILGIVAGVLQGLNYKQPVHTMDDTVINLLEIDDIQHDEKYYYNVFNEVKEKTLALSYYIQYLNQVDMDGNNQELVKAFEEKWLDFEEINDGFKMYYKEKTPIFFNSNTQLFLCSQLELAEEQLKDAETTISELNEGKFSKSFSNISESAALSKKIRAEEDIKIWKKQLYMVQNIDLKDLNAINKQMDILISELKTKLNSLVMEFNLIIEKIEEEEQYDIIYNPFFLQSYAQNSGLTGEVSIEEIMNNRKNSALIYAKSVSGVDSSQERFYSIIAFFLLFGITISIIYGAFYESKIN